MRKLVVNALKFQLTRPVWGEPGDDSIIQQMREISTHSPRVGRTPDGNWFTETWDISTHSPRVGRTWMTFGFREWNPDFNSLAPCGANLCFCVSRALYHHFNSLAPCGANLTCLSICFIETSFQLTRPVWGEPSREHECLLLWKFQLTRPVWGEPTHAKVCTYIPPISTHSPRVGRTRPRPGGDPARFNFNSLAPCGANHPARQ